MKKLVSLTLCFIMVFCAIPTLAFAQEAKTSGKCGDKAFWSYDETTKTLTISGEGAMFDTASDYGYEYLGENNARSIFENVIINDGITRIGSGAFSGLSIKNITIGKGVKVIGAGAFEQCSNTEKIVIPDNVEVIEKGAFLWCENLADVTLSTGLKTIEAEAFGNCYALKRIVIPSNVLNIGDFAFGYTDTWASFTASSAKVYKKLTIVAEYGSAAQKYAYKNGIKYDDINGCEKHIFGEKQIAIKKICTKQRGMYYKQCKNCNSRRFSFKSKSHTFKAGSTKTVRKATFFKNGIKTKYCTYCKKNIKFKTTKFINMPSVERKVYKNKVKFSLEKAQKGVTHYEIRIVKANGDYKNSQKIIAKVNDDIVFKNLKSNTDYEYERRYVIKNGKKTVKGNWYVSSFTTKK